jgi:hypothetical protein
MAVILFTIFSAFTSEAQINMQTPKEIEVAKYLKQNLAVFICFYNPAEPELAKINADIKSVTYNFIGYAEAVYVSGDDNNEDRLRERFKILPNETAVYIITPSGIAAAKLTGADITKTNLMRTLVSACGGGSCGPSSCGPR